MPYDTVVWGEAQAANWLTGVAFLAGQNHTKDGDKVVLKSTPTPPYLLGLGGLSDTKPQGTALVPDETMSQLPIFAPGGIDFFNDGWAKWLREIPIVLTKGEKVTGQISTTNVNEGQVIGADLAYKNAPKPWKLSGVSGRYSKVFTDKFTVTSAAAVTFNSGPVSLDSAASNYPKWNDADGKFEILGSVPNIGAATFGGIAHIRNLGDKWDGKQPGIVINPLSGVTFNPGGDINTVLEPIPFDGDALPEISMTATSAGAISFGLLIGKL
jgi:hypothetical protein